MADPYTTPDELRDAWPTLNNTDRYSDELLAGLVAEFEALVERARGVAYRRRDLTVTRRANDYGILDVSPALVDVTITEGSFDGSDIDADVIAELEVVSGIVFGGNWSRGEMVTLTMTRGFTEPPAGGVRVCGEFVRARALERTGNAPRNAIWEQTPDGTPLRLSTADWNAGRFTGLMVVDDWINAQTDYRMGFA